MNPNVKIKRTVFTLLLSVFCLVSFAQTYTVSGIVLDNSGTGIIGANIRVVGNTALGTITDVNGKFSFSVPQTAKQLEISYIGMQTQIVDIVKGSPIRVTMKENTKSLNEVVVIGYGTVAKKDLTGSVASISGKDISSVPVANVAQALQGKLSGVNVVSQDGRPDADISIRVRGGGSISQSNQPLILVDGVAVNSLSDIPSDMVQSIDVLKDASSTAIYGARGANGVILVTTKAAAAGKPTVSYSGYMKYNTPTKYLQALSPYDYLSYVWANAAANGNAYQLPFEKLYGLGANAGNNTGGIESYRNTPMTDVQKEVYNNSMSWNHNITINGGNENTKVLLSVNYLNDQGTKINSYYKRTNIDFKLDQKITKKVDFKLDTRYMDSKVMDDESTTNGSGSILSSAYQFRPIATKNILGDLTEFNDGNIEQYGKNVLWDQYNPAARAGDYDPLTLAQRLSSTASIDWKIINGLTFHTDYTYAKNWGQVEKWGGAIYNNYMDDVTGEKLYAGSVDYEKTDGWNTRWSNTLDYKSTFDQIHKLDVLAGQEITNSGGTGMTIKGEQFPANFTKDNAFAMINQAGSSSFSSTINVASRILSYFGRVNYSLLDRYLFTATFRADGSSKFSPEHRWGYFPAGAFAWRLSEEPFMQDVKWLDNLKIRTSFGEVGNDGINSDLWSQSWTSETDQRWQYTMNQSYLSSYDLSSSQMANPNLKWETTITRDAGVDFDILNGKLSGSVDVYWNTTKDLLLQTSIPGITGFTTTFANVGQTSNKGVEITLSSVIYRDKDWNISAGGNINFNRGNVDELAPNVTGLYGTNWASSSTYPAYDYTLKVGSPVGLVRGLTYEGFYTTNDFNYVNGQYRLKDGVADLSSSVMGVVHGVGNTERPIGQVAYPGLPKFKDLNGDGVIDDKDLSVIGNMNPIHTGGFNFSVGYKGIDLAANFNWSYGNQIYNVTKLANFMGSKEGGVYANKLAFMKDSYKLYDIQNGQLVRLSTSDQLAAANVNAKYPAAINEVGIASTLGIEDGSYLRLNNLTLGYSLPHNLLSKVNISKFRLYGTIYNLLTLTKYSGLDPEVNANTSQNHAIYPTTGLDWGSYPRSRSFVLGVNLVF